MGKMIIRTIEEKDYDGLIPLWQQAEIPVDIEGRERKDVIRKEVRRNRELMMVACDDGHIIASVIGATDDRKGWINRLAVHPEYRRQSFAIDSGASR